MTWAELLIHAVVIGVGLPAALRNPTAFALVVSWAAGQGVWMLTGNNLPLKAYFIADLTVIAIIYAKTIIGCGPKTYDGLAHQLWCMIADLSPWDRAIVALFVFGCWPAYVLSLDEWTKWYLLFAISIGQFLLAGGEAFVSWREAKRADPAEPDTPSSGPGVFRLAGNWRYG